METGYIFSKKNREFAEKLALKKYYEYKLNETEQELKALNAYLKYHRDGPEESIVLKFVEYGIPFRYEAALRLDDKVYYPDFTIRHRETGKIIYWEHFGLMR